MSKYTANHFATCLGFEQRGAYEALDVALIFGMNSEFMPIGCKNAEVVRGFNSLPRSPHDRTKCLRDSFIGIDGIHHPGCSHVLSSSRMLPFSGSCHNLRG